MATGINKDINLRLKSQSDLPEVNRQLAELINLVKSQGEATKQASVQWVAQTMAIKEYQAASTAAQTNTLKLQTQVLDAQKKTTDATKEQTAAMEKAAVQQLAATGSIKTSVDSIGSSFRNLATLVGIGFSVQQIKSFGMEVIDAKSKLDFFKVGLDNIIGSERAVSQVYSQLVNIAKTTPFSIDDLSKVTLSLSAMGIETNKLIPTIQALGDVSALAGSDKLPRIAKAYTDVMNKGILMKQEINQFSENSIPIYEMLAFSMEKTRDEVVKLAEDHKIGFADVEKAFKKATEEGGKYYNMAITQSQTLGGRMKNLSDTIEFAKAALGDYYENGLSNMISGFGDLVEAVGGSQKAIERSITWVKAAAAAILTYELATKGAAAVEAVMNGAVAAGNIIRAVFITSVGASTAATLGFTEAQIAAATAMKLTPWGIAVTLVGAATTAYLAFEAATMEVTNALGEEEIKIKGQQALFEGQLKGVMALAVGTKERTTAMQSLIRQYPEYLGGLSAETTNNAVLNQILGRVNQSYEDRIGLARQAYVIGELEKKRAEFLKEEYELMERVKKRSPELYAQVAGDVTKLQAVISKGSSVFLNDLDASGTKWSNTFSNLFRENINGAVNRISGGLKEVDKELLSATQRRETITRNEQKSALDAETTRWINVANQMKKGTKEYELAQQQHEKNMRQISGETTEYVIQQENKKVAKKKSSTEFALENDVKELKSAEQTHKVKLDLLNAEEALAKEQAKRNINNNDQLVSGRQTLEERLDSITVQFNQKRAKYMAEYIEKNMDYDMKSIKSAQAKVDKVIEAEKKQADAIEDLTLLSNDLSKKSADQKVRDWEKATEKLIGIAEKAMQDGIAIDADNAVRDKKFWQTKEQAATNYYIKLKERQIEEMQGEYERTAAHAIRMKELGDEAGYTKDLAALVELQNGIRKAEGEVSNARERQSGQTRTWLAAIVQAIGEVYKMIMDMQIEAMEQIVDSYGAMVEIWDTLGDANKKALDDIIKDTSLTYEELEQKLSDTLRNQSEIIAASDAMATMQRKSKDALEQVKSDAETTGKGIAAVTSFLNGNIGDTLSNLVGMASEWLTKTRRTFYEHEAMVKEQLAMRIQANMDRIENELAAETALYEKKLQLIDKDLQDFKDAETEKLNALKERQAEEMALMSQLSADKQLLLLEDQAFRNKLLDEGEAREVADLEEARQRLLAEAAQKNATAEEIANINIAFDELVKQKHNEYAQARGDKSKEVSLAIQEQKAQEKDALIASDKLVEQESKNSQQAIEDKAAEASINKQLAQEAYVKYVKEANRQLFEAEKQMAIANIQVEIALLKSKSHFLGIGKGKTEAAIAELEGVMNEIRGTWNPYSDTGAPPVTPPGRVTNPQPDNGLPKEQTPRPPTTGGPRGGYYGFEYLKPQAGDSYTRDSILMRLQHNERVVSQEPNMKLLKKAGFVSNDQLINGYLEYNDLKKSNPSLFAGGKIDYRNANILSALPGLMTMDFTKLQTLGAPELNFSSYEIVEAINGLSKKPVVNVTVSGSKVRTEEVLGNHKKVYERTYNKSL